MSIEKVGNKYSRGEIAKVILKSLLVVGATVLVLSSPYAARIIRNYLKGDRRKFMNSVKHLKRSRYVNSYYKDGQEVIEITEKGRKRSLGYDFEDMQIDASKKWDGIWRIVTYDIPEKRKRGRDQFVVKLKELGFHPYQKSIFVFPFDCREQIDFMKEHLFLGDSINYIEATHVDKQEDLKKVFGL